MGVKLRSMRARMTALFALFVALLMLAGGATVQNREERRAEKRTREILSVALERARAELADAESANAITNANATAKAKLADARQPRKSLLQAIMSDKAEITAGGLILMVVEDGKILYQSRRRVPRWPARDADFRVKTLEWNGQTLVLAHEWEPIAEELRETATSLWELGALVVIATAFGAWFLVGRTLSPLDKLAAQAQRAAGTESGIASLQVRLATPSSDAEMRHLTATLNDLLARLERDADARGRFYAAASHELRTPIQVLLGEIDVAKSRPRTALQHEQVLNQLQSHSERLAALVSDLLQLNALEMRQSQPPCEPLNLKFWIELAFSRQSAALEARGLHLECRIADTDIEAPPMHVEMLLRNLLENAVKYATTGTTLGVELKSEASGVVFAVWNACELPRDCEVEAWFEPFFRPDAARNSQTGGNGLGLSICRAICEANRWRIALQIEKHGLRAEVRFADTSATNPPKTTPSKSVAL